MKPIVKRDKAISETIDNVRNGNLWPEEAMVCLEEIAQEYAKQLALQVATEAVEEELNKEYPLLTVHGRMIYNGGCERVLKNIKKRLDA